MNRAAAPLPWQRHCLSLPCVAGIGTSHLPRSPAQALSTPSSVSAGGNAYNQLAVLASYEGDDLAAAFFYIRCFVYFHQVLLFTSGALLYIRCLLLHQVPSSTSGALRTP